jgi:hypothetical protein
MDSLRRNIPLLLLQPLPLLLFPPALLADVLLTDARSLIAIVIAIMWGVSWLVWRKRAWALTMSIFIQGLNVIIRVMMLLSNAVSQSSNGNLDVAYVVTSVLAIGLSWLFLSRLDNQDLRAALAA